MRLLVPLSWAVAMHVFPAWLLLNGVTLLAPAARRVREPLVR